MKDGMGTTTYSYVPINSAPAVGAGNLASVDGPLPNDTITYAYDELGRRVQTAINGVAASRTFDPLGRVIGETNALGSFTYAYDASSFRRVSETFPNGQTAAWAYAGNLQDRALQQITYTVGATPISQFSYGRDIPAGRIATWSQQAGAQTPSLYTLGYDAADQLLSATITNAEALINSLAYGYDLLGNRLTEQAGGTTNTATYNALNQLSTTSNSAGNSRTNEWDAANRLTAVNVGNQRTEFAYDGKGRLAVIRQLQNGSQLTLRRFVWCNDRICEERDADGGTVAKRFFPQGIKIETGSQAGAYYYSRDHLGSIHELTDKSGGVRARYDYDLFGRRTRVGGDIDSDFGFAGMFWASEAALSVTRFRVFDPELGRWLSRDPLKDAEVAEGPNLYAYVRNNIVNLTDPLGLCCEKEAKNLYRADDKFREKCRKYNAAYAEGCLSALKEDPLHGLAICDHLQNIAEAKCEAAFELTTAPALREYFECLDKPCKQVGGKCAVELKPRPLALPLGVSIETPYNNDQLQPPEE
jgi:RHS repeat-associated protein